MLLALRSLWESGATPVSTLPNPPGRVYKGAYPYFVPRRKKRPLDDGEDEIEELMVMLGIDL